MEQENQQTLTEPVSGFGVLKHVKKLFVMFLSITFGFGLGSYATLLTEREQSEQRALPEKEMQTVAEALAPYQSAGATAVVYEGGVALYLLEHEKGDPYCADHPQYTCRGSLYEISDNKLRKVASNVIGAELLYYEPGARALLQSGWGDGSCRLAKFYLYDFANASSSLDFDIHNDCDGSGERNNEYDKAITDYLAQFGL